eukprot:58990_1
MSKSPEYNAIDAYEDSDSEFKDITPLTPVDENQILEHDDTKTNNNPYLSMRGFNATNSFHTSLKQDKIELTTTDLDQEEIELLQSQIDSIVSKPPFQMEVFNKIISIKPSIIKSLSNNTNKINMKESNEKESNEKHCEILFKMLTVSYNYIINKLHKPLRVALLEHTKYNCSQSDLICILDTFLETILKHKSIKWSEKQYQKTNISWSKVHKKLKDMIHKIYTKRLKKYVSKIRRILPDNDIECVVSVWNKYIMKQQKEVADFLCIKFRKEAKFSNLFKQYSVDVTQQEGIIQLLQMWNTTINLVQNKEEIIPHLKALGLLHGKMGIKPQDLAIMKYILIELVKEVMGFDYNDNIKQSWNKVLTFYIGTMIQSLKEITNSLSYMSNTSINSHISVGINGIKSPALQYDINDIDDIQQRLTKEVIFRCQTSWKYILTVIDQTTQLFFSELVNTSIYSTEVSELFLNSDNKLRECKRMVTSIGSTTMLLDDIDKLIQILNELGRRHLYYNIKPKHFAYIRLVWFKCLKKALTIKWTKTMKYSWNVVWDFCVYFMKSSLEDALLLYIPPDPVSVKFKVLINHIDRVKVSDLSFYADIWFAAYTGNNASQSYAFGDDVNGVNNIPKNKSLPFGGIRCLNAMQISDRYRSLREPYIRYFEDNQSWYLRGHLVGTFSQTFDLRAYPFDKHDIEIVFALERDDSISSFDTEHISVRMMPFKLDAMAGCNYNVYEPTIELLEHSATKGGSRSGKKYTHCRIVIPISRIYTHSIYNIMLPLTVIELCAFSIYFTDLFPITARLILSMTLLLTLVAFRRSITTSLPPTPYLTVIDHTFNSACLLSFLHIVGLCVINQFQHLPMETTKVINLEFAFFALFVFVVVHIVLIWKAKHYIDLYPTHTVQDMLDNHDAMGMIARKIERQNTLSRSSVFPR